MNKSDLIDAIASHADIPKATARKVVRIVEDALRPRRKKAVPRRRTPTKVKAAKIKVAKIPKFRPGKALRDAIN